jgi:hypothetical protein
MWIENMNNVTWREMKENCKLQTENQKLLRESSLRRTPPVPYCIVFTSGKNSVFSGAESALKLQFVYRV